MSRADHSWAPGYDAVLPAGLATVDMRREVSPWRNVVTKAALCLTFACLLLPMYFMLTGSFQDTKGLMAMPPRLLPVHAKLDNYAMLIKYSQAAWIGNTLVIAAATVCLSVLVSCSGGYAFAFYAFPGKRLLWTVLLVGLMIPLISLVIPRYVIVRKLGISGTLLAAVVPLLFTPGGMYLARTYFQTVPVSLLESARLEGAGEWTVLFRVVMPVSRPIVAALSVLAAIGSLSDFLWQMLVLQKPGRMTLLVGLVGASMKRGGGDFSINPLGKGLAVGCLLVIPLLIVFVLGNRYMVGAIGGAVKE